MSFGADNVETAEADYFFVLGLDDSFGARESFVPLFVAYFVGIDLVLFKKLARHEIRIAAKQDVGAAARHVGGNGYGALASGLRYNLRFALVAVGVEDVVRHSLSE